MSLIAFRLSLFVVILSAVISWYEGNLSIGQMTSRGISDGFPFLKHTGMWSDLLLITPALGIMCLYAKQWSSGAIMKKLLIAVGVSLVLHMAWSSMTTVQEHILGPGMTFTASGLVHAFYLAAALSIVLLFYMNTESVQPRDAWIVTILLMVHIPLANAFVGFAKSGMFDAPGVIGTFVLMATLAIVHWKKFM